MKKWFKYLLLFVVSYSVINIIINLYVHQSWKDDQKSIVKLTNHCAKKTRISFDEYNKDIETQTQNFIQSGTNFTDLHIPYRESYKRCISNAIYNYTPQEYFNNSTIIN